MKHLILFAGIFISTLLNAQSKKEQQVQKAIGQLKQALISGNANDLSNIVSDKLSYGHSSGAVDDKTIFIEKLTSGKSDFVSIDLVDQTISINKKTAIVRHTLHGKTNDNNVAGEIHLKVLLIFHKENGKWVLLARQSVKLT